MPRATPESVSGYIRGPIVDSTICVERVYSQPRSGSGLSQIDFGNCSTSRCSHTTPGSSFMYSTLPPSCTSSYGLIAASPTNTSRQSGP